MEDSERRHQFSVRGLMILTALTAVLLAGVTRNYLDFKEERQIVGIPFLALRNYSLLWLFLCTAAIGTAVFAKVIRRFPGLIIFIFATGLLCLLNFLAPLGAL